jgi:hypothetical protein
VGKQSISLIKKDCRIHQLSVGKGVSEAVARNERQHSDIKILGFSAELIAQMLRPERLDLLHESRNLSLNPTSDSTNYRIFVLRLA